MPQIPSFTKTYHTSSYPALDPSDPALSTAGKNIVVTGGGSGVGAGIATAFAKAGAAHVLILGRTQSTLEATKDAIEHSFPKTKIIAVVADVASADSVVSASKRISEVGAWDVFVHNAGYMPDLATIASADTDDWWTGFTANVLSVHLIAKHFFPLARTGTSSNSPPTFMAISSAAMHAGPGMAAGKSATYGASKLAAAKLVEILAVEHPEIRSFNVHPGFQDTAMSQKFQAPSLGPRMDRDDPDLPGNFCVWMSSARSNFLRGRFVWCNWDVEELMQEEEEISKNPMLLTTTLGGWPFPSRGLHTFGEKI